MVALLLPLHHTQPPVCAPSRPPMADLKNTARQVATAARSVKYTKTLSLPELVAGEPALLLDILRHGVADFSPYVWEAFVVGGVRLPGGPADIRLCEALLRGVHSVLGVRARVSPAQFMTPKAFVEGKHKVVAAALAACTALHHDRSRAEALAALRVVPHVPPPPAPLPVYIHPRLPTTHLRPASAATASSSRAAATEFAAAYVQHGSGEDVREAAKKVHIDRVRSCLCVCVVVSE